MGLSGKIRIHTFPSRFMARVIAWRADSICRLLSHIGSSAFSAKEPKDIVAPRLATCLIRPFCAFLCFVLFGCNIILQFENFKYCSYTYHSPFIPVTYLRSPLPPPLLSPPPAPRLSPPLLSPVLLSSLRSSLL